MLDLPRKLPVAIRKACMLALLLCSAVSIAHSQSVTANVNVTSPIAIMPEYGMGIHTSVYDNALRHEGSAAFNQLDGALDGAGVNVLRYPGGGYADIFHFSTSRGFYDGGMTGHGFTPWWGEEDNYGYMSNKSDFGNFVKLLDATNSKTIITLNTGGALKYDNPANPSKLVVPSHGGQPQEAAAWVAYANADANLYGTASDIPLGIDAEGNDWKTAGYWAKLRASTQSQYNTWANDDGVYDPSNAFLAINRDDPVGIEYWEIGNETFGTGYYGGTQRDFSQSTGDDFGYRQYALNYAVPYDGTLRDDNPALSPAAYGEQVNAFVAAMKSVDPTIKTGAVLATPPDDYVWSYADLNDNGRKDANEPYWNDEVLSHTDAGLGKVADNIDFAIVHWYPSFSQSDTAGILNAPRTTIPRMIHGTTAGIDVGSDAGLRDSIATWRTDGDQNGLEIFVTETDGAGHAPAIDGLFAADEYVTFFENGVSNVDWFELHSSFLTEGNSPDFAYYGIQAAHLLAKVGDEFVSTSTSEDDVRIHASRRADGSVGVMVLNMNATERVVAVSINGSTLSSEGTRYDTTGDSPLWPSELSDLGNDFTTTISGRSLQLFVLSPAVALPGDFNDDGFVDIADYTLWRDNLGGSADLLANNIDSETIGIDQYNTWAQSLGAAFSGSQSAASPVPAPPSQCLLLLAALVPLGRTLIHRHRCRRVDFKR